MTNPDQIVKCTRCRNKHKKSERILKRDYKNSWNDVVCPKCEGKVYTEVKEPIKTKQP